MVELDVLAAERESASREAREPRGDSVLELEERDLLVEAEPGSASVTI